jgi:hypothetical protein
MWESAMNDVKRHIDHVIDNLNRAKRELDGLSFQPKQPNTQNAVATALRHVREATQEAERAKRELGR